MADGELRPIDRAVLAIILATAAVLRLIMLDSPLWYDEILTLTGSVRLPLGELLSDHSSFNNHPFYSLQAKGAIWLFGESNWSLRLPAMLFGVASIAAVWQLAYLLSDALRAHVTALLVTFSYHHIWYSQNARAYTELMFWFITSTIVLIHGVRKPATRTWVLYGVLLSAGMYTHLTAASFFLAHAIIVAAILAAPLLGRGGTGPHADDPALPWSMPLIGFLIGGVSTLVLYAPSLERIFTNIAAVESTSQVDVMVEYQSPIWTALEMIRSVATPSPPVILVAIAVLVLIGMGVRETHRREPIAGATMLLHIPLTLVILLALSARIWPRFFFADMGFVLFFLTQGVWVSCGIICRMISALPARGVSPRNLFIVSAALMVAISSVLAVRNYRFPKQDFAGALAYIEAQRAASESVVTLGLASVPFEYFETGWPAVETTLDVVSAGSPADRTWLVMAFPSRTTRKYSDVMEHLDAHFSLAREFPGTLGDGQVRVYVENRP